MTGISRDRRSRLRPRRTLPSAPATPEPTPPPPPKRKNSQRKGRSATASTSLSRTAIPVRRCHIIPRPAPATTRTARSGPVSTASSLVAPPCRGRRTQTPDPIPRIPRKASGGARESHLHSIRPLQRHRNELRRDVWLTHRRNHARTTCASSTPPAWMMGAASRPHGQKSNVIRWIANIYR